MGLLSSLKNFFVPSEEESARRRLAAFGTESKTVAALAVGTAAVTALVAAPIITGGALARTGVTTAVKAVASKVVTSFTGANLLTQGAIVTGGIVGAGILSKTDKPVEVLANAPSNLFDAGQDIGDLVEEPSLDKAMSIIKKHPGLSASALVALLVTAGFASSSAINIVTNYLNRKATNENTEALLKGNEKDDVPLGGGSPPAGTSGLPDNSLKNSPPEAPLSASPLGNGALVAPPLTTQSSRSVMKGSPQKRRRAVKAPMQLNNRINLFLDNRQKIYI